MDRPTSVDFAAFLELHEFESPLRDALLRDIRAGVYAPGRLADPWMSLRLALRKLKAEPVVMKRFESLCPSDDEPAPLTDEQIARLAALDVPDFEAPTDPDMNGAIDAFVNIMVPADGHFMKALLTPQ